MSQDVLLRIQDDGTYDLEIDGADFAAAEGFETAIPLSLFADARAPASRVPEAQRRRGWVGNIATADTGRQLGSILWLLDQARLTQDTVNDARSFARDALRWAQEDGVVLNGQVDVLRLGVRGTVIAITLTRSDNRTATYSALWRATDASVLPNV